ncbi:type II toxin-antitoxin system VapC family toxin [Thermosulfurimonas sp.]|uniref:type II toxin-antitoxin system VapC family toxin n=1 Tax=Thermosulfurimonas sp. TaxID=2080236 RepID=UPI0025DA56C3|nr:type II toxin-antitoxin system VapC family toxin [Thermosulfurimonas sp.]
MNRKRFVLDSYAILAFFQKEPGSDAVYNLLKEALAERVFLFLSIINLGEIFYITAKRLSLLEAKEIINDVQSLPIRIENAPFDRVLKAAEIKASYPLSYADSFAAALAEELKATLVTGDPEFKSLKDRISILWL